MASEAGDQPAAVAQNLSIDARSGTSDYLGGRAALGKRRPRGGGPGRVGHRLGHERGALFNRGRIAFSTARKPTFLGMRRPMLSRRQFMRRTSLVSLYPVVPSLLGRIASAATADSDARTLVVVQL